MARVDSQHQAGGEAASSGEAGQGGVSGVSTVREDQVTGDAQAGQQVSIGVAGRSGA